MTGVHATSTPNATVAPRVHAEQTAERLTAREAHLLALPHLMVLAEEPAR